MIVGDVALTVTPDVLIAKADLVAEGLKKMQENLDTIDQIVSRTSGYWIGEAGNLHRQMYQDEKEDIATIMKRLNEHPVDLRAIAQNYLDAEQTVEEIANSLPGDVIK